MLSAQHTVIGANPSRGNALSNRGRIQGVWVAGAALSVAPATAVADAPPLDKDAVRVRLVDIAWGRSGDKGDKFNVAVIARKPEFMPYIRAALTEEVVMEWFAHEFRGAANPRVERFDVPAMHAINFLLHEALGGGGMATLRVDQLAKGKAQQLLEIPVPIPVALAKGIKLAA